MTFIFTQNKQAEFSYLFDQNSLFPHESQQNDRESQEKTNFNKKSEDLYSSSNPIEFFKMFVQDLGKLKDSPITLSCQSTRFNSSFIREFGVETIEGFIIKSSINIKKKNWGKYDVIILLWMISKYSLLHSKPFESFISQDWEYISRLIPGKDSSQCKFKWLNIVSFLEKSEKQPWTHQEDNLLIKFVTQNQQINKIKWHEISKSLYETLIPKVFRTGKQCRQRWVCFLNPGIKKGYWKLEQDVTLLQNFLELGKKWSEIAKKILGRTENSVKNRFKLIISKKYRQRFKHGYISDNDFIIHHLQHLKLSIQNQKKQISNAIEPKNQQNQYTQFINNNKKETTKQSSPTKNITKKIYRCHSNKQLIENHDKEQIVQNLSCEYFGMSYNDESPNIFKQDLKELKDNQKQKMSEYFYGYYQ